MKSWQLAVFLIACFSGNAVQRVAIAQIGSWPGAPGYGGLYGGYSGYRGYETGYPANTDGSRRVYGDAFEGNIGRAETGGGLYYSQPFETIGRPAIRPFNRRNRGPIYPTDATPMRQIYTGSSPVVTTPPAILESPPAIHDQGEIVLFSPPTNTIEVHYSLNGTSYTMKPGSLQKFANDRTWTIEVNLGNGQSTRYTLHTGRFKFKQSETGMGLFSTQESPEVAAPAPDPEKLD